jgi:toxin ParE1/3/4
VTTFRVTPRAARDLDEIARWTLEQWGVARMERYLRALNARFEWLAQHPKAGRARDDVAAGYRSFAEGQHLIFYIIHENTIAIIGMPHQAMDVGGYFD